jgi:transcriptional regulator with XRE-family HTH domain
MAHQKLIGERLRNVRLQKRLTLKEVEARSKGSFKVSVLGAYERGHRQITVARLCQLAKLYQVTPTCFLDDEKDDTLNDTANAVPINLRGLERLPKRYQSFLSKYIQVIKRKRGDLDDKTVTLRRDDIFLIACILHTSPDKLNQRLEKLSEES